MLSDCEFAANEATDEGWSYGGAVFLFEDAEVELDAVAFDANQAADGGEASSSPARR